MLILIYIICALIVYGVWRYFELYDKSYDYEEAIVAKVIFIIFAPISAIIMLMYFLCKMVPILIDPILASIYNKINSNYK